MEYFFDIIAKIIANNSSYQIVLSDSVYRIYFGAFDHRIITLTDYRTRGDCDFS